MPRVRTGTRSRSYTCIEPEDSGGTDWQCWASTLWSGDDVEVGHCHATGRCTRIHSTSSGELELQQQQCPTP